jgi:hypothetical protein
LIIGDIVMSPSGVSNHPSAVLRGR